MDNNIVSFIESIEPDLSYEGSMGAMTLIVESNENMLAIEDYINKTELYSVYAEEAAADDKPGVVDKIKEYGGKAKAGALKIWDYIVTAIKRAIAKIKGLFFQATKKLRVIYTQAMNKIRELLAKAVTNKNRGVAKVKWYSINMDALNGYINKFNPNTIFSDVKSKQFNAAAFEDEARNSIGSAEGARSINAVKYLSDILGMDSEDVRNLGTILKEKCLKEESTITVSQEDVKKLFDTKVITSLNNIYKDIMTVNEGLLKIVSEKRKEAMNAEDRSAALKLANAMNRVQSANASACGMFFNAVFGVVAKALHSAIKATLYAIKSTATGAVKDAYGSVKKAVAGKPKDDDEIILA